MAKYTNENPPEVTKEDALKAVGNFMDHLDEVFSGEYCQKAIENALASSKTGEMTRADKIILKQAGLKSEGLLATAFSLGSNKLHNREALPRIQLLLQGENTAAAVHKAAKPTNP